MILDSRWDSDLTFGKVGVGGGHVLIPPSGEDDAAVRRRDHGVA